MPDPPNMIQVLDRGDFKSAKEFAEAASQLYQQKPPFQYAFQIGTEVYFQNYDTTAPRMTDDLMHRISKADAARMARHTEASAVAKAVSISREASLRSRPYG